MNTRVILLSVGLVVFAPSLTYASSSLKDLYQRALAHSERIAISEAAVKEAQALYRQAVGESFPAISYRRASGWDQGRDENHDGMFRLSQTALTGYGELANVRSGRSFLHQKQYEYERVKQLLLGDVAVAFYALLLAEENASATDKLITLANDRLTELNDRVRIGRTRESDAVSQGVLVASLESQREESLRQVNARLDLLAFLTGSSEIGKDVADDNNGIEDKPLEAYLQQVSNRPDVRAAQADVQSAEALRKVARGQFLPDVSVTANAYTDRSEQQDDWDVSLIINVPLWTWGERRGALQAASAVLTQKQQTLDLARRQAELDVRNAFRDYESARKQSVILKTSVELARQDYDIQVRDDKQGLVTNLDVFSSLDRLNNSELAYNNARLQEKLAAINLRVAAGDKPEDILK